MTGNGNTLTDRFVRLLDGIRQEEIPPRVIRQADLCLEDYRSLVAPGASLLGGKGLLFVREAAARGGNSRPEGYDVPMSVQDAAFVNAMCVHATELDDGHRKGMIHLGASILSALLAADRVEHFEKESLLRGIVAGYEAAIRLAMAMQPSHKLRGFHTSGTCGTVGAAVALAVALRLPLEQLKTAVSCACAGASGLLEMQEDGSELKPYNVAQAAVGGVQAAYTARAGFLGPADAVGGKRGVLAVLSDSATPDLLTGALPYEYQIEGIYRKPYAACRHCHPAVEAVLRLRSSQGIRPSQVEKIIVETYRLAIAGHDHKQVPNLSSAKLSIPFSVALALVTGKAGLSAFCEENLHSAGILDLTDKVQVVENEELSALSPEKRAAQVRVVLKGGSVFTCRVDDARGEPENPMDETDFKNRM